MVNQSSFGVDERRKIHEVDKVQVPQVSNPGPGKYGSIQYQKKKQDFTSNMMS